MSKERDRHMLVLRLTSHAVIEVDEDEYCDTGGHRSPYKYVVSPRLLSSSEYSNRT